MTLPATIMNAIFGFIIAYGSLSIVCLPLIDVGGKINFAWRYLFGLACFVGWSFSMIGEQNFEAALQMTPFNFRLVASSIFAGAIVVWYILIRYYLIVSPILWRITEWQLAHTLRWRNQSYTSTLGKWVINEQSKMQDRMYDLGKKIPLVESYAQRKYPGMYGESGEILRSVSSGQGLPKSMRHSPERIYGKPIWNNEPQRPTQRPIDREESDNSHMNGKVKWTEVGKQYKRNKGALNRIIGMEKAKTEIREAIEIPIARPDLVKKYGYKNAGGMILYGPPWQRQDRTCPCSCRIPWPLLYCC